MSSPLHRPAPDSGGVATWMICMEYCESDLDKRIYGDDAPETKVLGATGLALSAADVLAFALQIAEGMAYVHRVRDLKGELMSHLDLKPENILLARSDRGANAEPGTVGNALAWVCKVADFGMDDGADASSSSTLVRTASPSASDSGQWVGTPEYMS
eukprot:COSAG02_NODE_22289_length_757_cov_1.139818_1_plen_157_part_00